jgi:hypothetical protein
MVYPVGVSSALVVMLASLPSLPISPAFILAPRRAMKPTSLRVQAGHRHFLFNDDYGPQEQQFTRREAWQHAAAVTTTASGLLLPTSSLAEDTTSATIKPGTVPTVRLGTGSLQVSRTIQGYWQLAGGHGRYKESDALANMEAHYKAGITTLDTADIYGPSEIIMGKFMAKQPKAIPCTKFCCFRFLDEITRDEVRQRIQKVRKNLYERQSKMPPPLPWNFFLGDMCSFPNLMF